MGLASPDEQKLPGEPSGSLYASDPSISRYTASGPD